MLTSERNPGYVLCWGRGFAFVSTGEEKLWVQSELIKIILEQERCEQGEVIVQQAAKSLTQTNL